MSEDNVTHIGDKSGDAIHYSPEQTLREAIDALGKEGAFKNCKKILVIALDDNDEQYNVNFIQSGMKMSECNNLCDVAKSIFKSEMGY